MAGPFSTVAEKRAYEMTSNRTNSLDIISKTAPSSTTQTPVHHSSDALSSGIASNPNTPFNYFRSAHSQIIFGKLNFLITHMPQENSVDAYLSDLKRYHVTNLIRVCVPAYSSDSFTEHGIKVHDWIFEDGYGPPTEIIQKFLALCLEAFSSSNDCIAIHCVAGLGRAPILVAIALLEAGMKCDDAILLIRSQRRGALNDKQLEFLHQYKPSGRLRRLRYATTKQRKSCLIM